MPNRSKDIKMSCIVVSVERVGSPMIVSADMVGSPMIVSADMVSSPMIVSASRVGVPITARVSKIGKPMEISARLVCTINGEFYMRVSPDVIWLDPNDATVYVESNVNWIIE